MYSFDLFGLLYYNWSMCNMHDQLVGYADKES